MFLVFNCKFVHLQEDFETTAQLDLDLRIVLETYKQKQELSRQNRIVLSKSIIKYLLLGNFDRRIKKEEFESLAAFIVAAFPTENGYEYFVPATNKKLAKGKLWDAFCNFRKSLSDCGLITRKKKIATSSTNHNQDEDQQYSPADKTENALIFLETNVDDWDVIKKEWTNTEAQRFSILEQLTWAEYALKFPCLAINSGYELVIQNCMLIYTI